MTYDAWQHGSTLVQRFVRGGTCFSAERESAARLVTPFPLCRSLAFDSLESGRPPRNADAMDGLHIAAAVPRALLLVLPAIL